eukprot:gene1576-1145_t
MDIFVGFNWNRKEVVSNRDKFLQKDRNGQYGLHIAAKLGVELALLKEIVEINPDALREKDKFGCLPIHYASNCRTTTLEALQFFVNQSPRSIRERDGVGLLPIHHLAQHQTNVEFFSYIDSIYSDAVREKDKDGWISLHFAAKSNTSVEVLQFLVLRYAGGLREATVFGSLPIHCAAHYNKNLAVLEYLVSQHPGGLNEKGANGMLPLHSAARNNPSVAVLDYLIGKNPDGLTTGDKNGRVPLHHAVRNPNASVILRYLTELYPAMLRHKDTTGWTPLHNAARYASNPAVLRYLAEQHPAALQTADEDGWLPLHHCARGNSSNMEVLKLLVDLYPDALTTKNADNYPHDLAPATSDARSYLTLFHVAMQLDGRHQPMDVLRLHMLGDVGSGKSMAAHWLKTLLPADSLNVDLFDETHDIAWRHGRTQGMELNHVTLRLSDRVTHYLIQDYSGASHHLAHHLHYLHAPDSCFVLVLPLFDRAKRVRNSLSYLTQRLLYWTRLLFSRARPSNGGVHIMILLNAFVSDVKISTDELQEIKSRLIRTLRRNFTLRHTCRLEGSSVNMDDEDTVEANGAKHVRLGADEDTARYSYNYYGNSDANLNTQPAMSTTTTATTTPTTEQQTVWLLGGDVFVADLRSKFSLNRPTSILRHQAPLTISSKVFRQSRILTYCWEVINMIDFSAVMQAEDVMQMLASAVRSFFTKQPELDQLMVHNALRKGVCEEVEARLLQHLIAFLVRLEKLRLLDTTSFFPDAENDRLVITDPTAVSRHIVGAIVQQVSNNMKRSVVELAQTPRELASWVRGMPAKTMSPAVPLEKLLTQLGFALPMVQRSQPVRTKPPKPTRRVPRAVNEDGGGEPFADVGETHAHGEEFDALEQVSDDDDSVDEELCAACCKHDVTDYLLEAQDQLSALSLPSPAANAPSAAKSANPYALKSAFLVDAHDVDNAKKAADGSGKDKKKSKKKEKERLRKEKKKAKKKAKKAKKKAKKEQKRREKEQRYQKRLEEKHVFYYLHSLVGQSCLDSDAFVAAGLKPISHAQRCVSRVFRLVSPRYVLPPGYLASLTTFICAAVRNQAAVTFYRDGLRLLFRHDADHDSSSDSDRGHHGDLTQILIVPHVVSTSTLSDSTMLALTPASFTHDAGGNDSTAVAGSDGAAATGVVGSSTGSGKANTSTTNPNDLVLGFEVHISSQIPVYRRRRGRRAGGSGGDIDVDGDETTPNGEEDGPGQHVDVAWETMTLVRSLITAHGQTSGFTVPALSPSGGDATSDPSGSSGHNIHDSGGYAVHGETCCLLFRGLAEFCVHPKAPIYRGTSTTVTAASTVVPSIASIVATAAAERELMSVTEAETRWFAASSVQDVAPNLVALYLGTGLDRGYGTTRSNVRGYDDHTPLVLGLSVTDSAASPSAAAAYINLYVAATTSPTGASAGGGSQSQNHHGLTVQDLARMTMLSHLPKRSSTTVAATAATAATGGGVNAESDAGDVDASFARDLTSIVLDLLRHRLWRDHRSHKHDHQSHKDRHHGSNDGMHSSSPRGGQGSSVDANGSGSGHHHHHHHHHLVAVSRDRVRAIVRETMLLRNAFFRSTLFTTRNIQDLPWLPADAFPGYLLRVLSQVAKEDAGTGTGGNPPAGEVVPQWDDDVVAALELSVSALENALRVQPRHAQTAEFGALMQDTLELLLTHVASTADTASTSSAAVLHRAQRLFRVQQGVFASLKHVINRGARTGYLFAEDIYGTGSSSSSTPAKVVLVDENREHLLPSTESGGGLRMTPAMNAGLRKLLLAAGDEHVLHTGLRKVSDPLGNAVCVCAAAAKRSGGGVGGALGKTIRNAVMGFMDTGNDDGSGGGVGGTGRLYEPTGSGRQPENNGKGYDEVVSTVGLSTCAKEFLQRGTNALVVRVKL